MMRMATQILAGMGRGTAEGGGGGATSPWCTTEPWDPSVSFAGRHLPAPRGIG